MRNFILVIAVFFSFSFVTASEAYDVKFNQTKGDVFELNFSVENYDLTEINIDGTTYSKILFDGSVYTQLKGFAQLPMISATVQLSADKNVSLNVIEGEYEEFSLEYPLLPSRGVIYRDQDPSTIPYVISPSSFRDNWYPQNLATNTTPFILRDVRGTSVNVFPFRYNAVKNVLRIYKSMTVELIENETQAINPLPKQATEIVREMDAIYNSVFINYNLTRDDLTVGEYGDLLVITTARDEDAIEPYIEWKKEKGYSVTKEVVATGTNVKNLIQNAYNANNDLLYVQLVGDWADIKSDNMGGSPMDPQLGCVVGSDNHADICIGRFSANNPGYVTIQVNKTINYEKNPDSDDWYSSALGVASNQGPGDDNELDYQHIDVIYNDKQDPYTYDNFSTAYDYSGTAAMVTNAINDGVSAINYCGHGSQTSWGSTGFSNSHVNNLTNGSKLPFIFSVACVNGAFQGSGDCFAEAWLKKENGGAIVVLMATINQPWTPPMRGQDYFNDVIIGGYDYSAHPGQNGINTSEQRNTLGAVVFNGLVLMTTESGSSSDWETAKTWIYFGDVALQHRTIEPAPLALSNEVISVGMPYDLIVTSNGSPVAGAMVCISQNGEYFNAITDADGHVNIEHDFLSGEVLLVVTSLNTETIYENISIVSATQNIDLSEGYQFVSTHFEIENADMLVVLEDILNENLDFVRNSDGTTLRKIGPNWVNGIGDWVVTEGYLFKMFGSETVEFSGVEIAASTPIDLVAGFQFVSYLPTEAIDALYAFNEILGDNLHLIRNSNGEMLRKIGPNWVNGIGDATPGEGYLIKMYADDQLVYNTPVKSTLSNLRPKVIEHFVFDGGNAADPIYTMYISGLEVGDEVAAFDGDLLVGSTVIRSDNKFENSLPIFSTLTNSKGFNAGNQISLKVWDIKNQMEIVSTFNFESDFEAYTNKVFPTEDNEYSFVNISKGSRFENTANDNISVYPNPANNNVNIVSNETINDVQVLNFLGQVLLNTEVNDAQMKINTSDYQAGIYIFRINTLNSTIIKKVTIK